MRLKLPHIPRFFSATIFPTVAGIMLWIALLSLIAYNVYLQATRPLAYQGELLTVFAQPFAAIPHISLAQMLWQYGSKNAARMEMGLADSLLSSHARSQVLGATTDPQETLAQWNNAPSLEKAQIHFWKDTVVYYPDYRDGFIELASLYYTQGNLIEAKKYMDEASALDPNGETVNILNTFLTKLLR